MNVRFDINKFQWWLFLVCYENFLSFVGRFLCKNYWALREKLLWVLLWLWLRIFCSTVAETKLLSNYQKDRMNIMKSELIAHRLGDYFTKTSSQGCVKSILHIHLIFFAMVWSKTTIEKRARILHQIQRRTVLWRILVLSASSPFTARFYNKLFRCWLLSPQINIKGNKNKQYG
jgi:hypothetical protein